MVRVHLWALLCRCLSKVGSPSDTRVMMVRFHPSVLIGLSFNGRITGSNPVDMGSNPMGPVYGGSSSVGKNAGL